MDRCDVAVLTHIELKTSVVIVLVLHLEIERECLPFGSKIDRGVRQVSYPAGIRGRYADYTLARFIRLYVERYAVIVALEHRQIRMNELDGVFFRTVLGRCDDHLAVLDLSCTFTIVEKEELPVDIVCEVFCYREISVAYEVTVSKSFTERHRRFGYVGVVFGLLIYADIIYKELSLAEVCCCVRISGSVAAYCEVELDIERLVERCRIRLVVSALNCCEPVVACKNQFSVSIKTHLAGFPLY